MKGICDVRFVSGAAALSAAVFACATPASGALVAAWSFNSYDGTSLSVASSSGTGTLTIDAGWAGDLGNPPGTTLNAVGADPAGLALQLKNDANNLLGIEFAISTVGLQDLVLTFASSRNNAQGFNLNQVSYSSNGGTSFMDLGGTYDPTTTLGVLTFDFTGITALDGNSAVVIRITLDGAGNQNGNNLIDNVQFNAVPEPGTIALLGVAALIGFRRRRRA